MYITIKLSAYKYIAEKFFFLEKKHLKLNKLIITFNLHLHIGNDITDITNSYK